MPAVTKEQFNEMIQLSVDRIRDAIITNHPNSKLIKKKYPQGKTFDDNLYRNKLIAIYGKENDIPDVFTQLPSKRLSVTTDNVVLISYALEICLIVDSLNSADSMNLTAFNLPPSLQLRDRHLDVSILLEE
ncbi:MAG TPA: hypothetical protein VHD33_05205, partial [Legionellaceae bacterium]|nr:hypothetical protein [Legionellaceae bacterium]